MLEDELKEETLKWLERIEEEIENISAVSESDDFMANIRAYISDSRYFLEKSDLIRAFEAVIWAWAWLEIGIKLSLLDKV
jgi:hypothetical protein